MSKRLPPRRSKRTTSDHAEEPRVLSSEEKRELILAHAEARTPTSSWGFGYVVGIAASCLVVVSGWWWTLGTNLRTDISSSPNPKTQELQATLEKWRSITASSTSNASNEAEVKARVEALKNRFHAEFLKAQASSTTSKP